MTEWRTYSIGTCALDTRLIYAPSLAEAFDIARRQWGSKTLTCFQAWKGRSRYVSA